MSRHRAGDASANDEHVPDALGGIRQRGCFPVGHKSIIRQHYSAGLTWAWTCQATRGHRATADLAASRKRFAEWTKRTAPGPMVGPAVTVRSHRVHQLGDGHVERNSWQRCTSSEWGIGVAGW